LLTLAAHQECCRNVTPADGANNKDVKALSRIVMESMQIYCKEDRAVGIEDLGRWPSDCDVVDFLSATTSAASTSVLMKVSRD